MSKKVFRRPAVSSVAVAKGLKTASMDAIADAVADLDPPERLVVEGATVVCTQMFEPESQSKMKKTEGSIGIMRQGAYELTYKDIEFEPLFEKCKKCGGDCEPEIYEEQWFDYDDTNEINDEYGILEEKSFMICLKGYGMLYISEDGQRPSAAKRLAVEKGIKRGVRESLGAAIFAAFGGDPVNMATGNFVYLRTDLEILGQNPLLFKRFYNAFDPQISTLGKGWRHPYDISLKETKKEVIITFGDGHDEVYKIGDQEDKNEKPEPKKEKEKKSEAPKGYFFEMRAKEKEQQKQKNKKNENPQEKPKGYRLNKPGEALANLNDKSCTASDGIFNQLLKAGNTYRLVKSDGTTLHFDENGNLTKAYDHNQVAITLRHENNKLMQIKAPSGGLSFTYEGDKISTVTDHTGRRVAYTYDGDLLTSATDPLGNVYTYSYDEKGRFLNEINPENNLMVENEYDEEDRVIKQRFADGSTMGYVYDDEKMTTEFIAQNGAKTTYYYDDLDRTTDIEYPDNGEIQTEFNWKDQKISETDEIGARTYFDYDDKGNIAKITTPPKDAMEMEYDNANRLIKMLVNGIVTLRQEFDSEGHLVAAEDSLKRQVRFAYDKETKGLPTHMVQPDGSVIKLKYDDRRNVTKITDAFGVSTHYEYDDLNRTIKTIDGNGNETHFSYDLNNNITRVTNAEGNSCVHTYNKAKKITNITYENGTSMSFAYNNLNKPSAITDQLGRKTDLNYDKLWNVNHVIQPNGAEANFIYDENNRLITVKKPNNSEINFVYDENGNEKQIIDEEGNSTFFAYDELQRLIEVRDDDGIQLLYTYDLNGNVTSVTDALENVARFMYNMEGELLEEINAAGDSKTYTYTHLGKVETICDEIGRVVRFEYEPGGRLKSIQHPTGTIETFTYDGNGNLKTHVNELGLTVTYVYDCLNRVIEIINEDGGSKKYTYDVVGNVTSVTNELGYTTNYSYTLTNQLEKVTDARGFETLYTYDELDQIIEVKQLGEVDGTDGIEPEDLERVNAHNEASRITKYKRDLLGQVTSVTDALGQIERYKYSPTGELIEKIDKEGYATKYGYTNQGDVNYVKYADGKEVHMTYNALGELTKVHDWLGTTSIEVDISGQPLSVTNHRNERVEYRYGKMGERRSIIYPDGQVVKYHYDEMLRLTQIQDGEQFTNYIYDQYNRLIEKKCPNDMSTEYQYNELGQLQQLNHYNLGKSHTGRSFKNSLDQYYFSYDKLGNKTRVNKSRDGFEGSVQEFRYDEMNRLRSVIGNQEILRKYEYDPFGNRVKKFEAGDTSSYSYNSLNQLISMRDQQGLHEYRYDARGNCNETYRNNELIHRHHFGALNRLEGAFNYEQGKGAFYDYNSLGHRVGKRVGLPKERVTPETVFGDIRLNIETHVEDVIDPTKQYHNLLRRTHVDEGLVDENLNQGKRSSTNFIWDSNVLSARNEEENFHYFHDDLGSPIRLVNNRGHIDATDFDEFGNVVKKKSFAQFDNPFTYTGYQACDLSSTLFAQAREYKPEIGRFVSQDLIAGLVEQPITMNQYTYCWNDPLNLVDLNGLFPVIPPYPEPIKPDPDPELDLKFIGRVYRIKGANHKHYTGSTTKPLAERFSRHYRRVKDLLRKPDTIVYYRNVYAKIDIKNSNSKTTRSATTEALISVEQPVMDEAAEKKGESLNKGRAAKKDNVPDFRSKHKVISGHERVWKNPNAGKVKISTSFVLLRSISMHRDMQMANTVWSPLIFCDDYNSFTLQYRRNWLGIKTDWYRNYLDGPLAGQQVPTTRSEFNEFRDMSRELWGYVNMWGNFVPGTLQPYLPEVAPWCNDLENEDSHRRNGGSCLF